MMQLHHKRHDKMMHAHNNAPDASPRSWVKLALSATVEHSGLGRLARRWRRVTAGARIFVLAYHRVVDEIAYGGPINPSLCVTADSFRRQMEQLRARFTILPLASVVRAVRGEGELLRDAAAVTFDDGYRDLIVRAAPILRALGIPATVFVPTGFDRHQPAARLLPHDRLYAALWSARRRALPLSRLGDSETALQLARAEHLLAAAGPAAAVDELIRLLPASALARLIATLEQHLGPPALDGGAAVLQPAEVRALADDGWEIGGHTEGHVVLTHEPLDEVRRQLAASKADLERWSGRPCRYFAYCNGYHSRRLVDELRRAGYAAAVTTCDRSNAAGDDVFRLGRKVLWEAHARGPRGRFSPALSAAHLHDLFGALGLTTPIDGDVDDASAQQDADVVVQTHNNDLAPTEVELAY
jgi:peptidoglycan/xylan/chitin deacetylase (PgdA/CDA1 family)